VNANINIRTTSELKTNANEVLKRMGLDMSTAVNLFLTQVVYRNAIPFEISATPRKTAKLGGWET
jgi:DNA-damage-inducible protein J